MKDLDWVLIETLFDQALALPEAQRPAFLTEQCQNNAELRAEVESLLAHSELTQSINGIVDHASHSLLEQQQNQTTVGQIIDRYRIIRSIGQGGMGHVYLAERADKQYEQQVALKTSRNILSNKELLLRFKTERQILANLEHANIARLLDGGTTESNIPYLVMEYIEGLPIDDYCEQHKLTIKQRLALFQHVCDAVKYAHQQLIIHCDLKPSNILVTQDGQVKLLDFGISKLLDNDSLSGEKSQESGQSCLLTLQYSSPEQIQDKPLNTASDIYSLGVILFKLLTGLLPFDGKTEALKHTILNTQAPFPSERVKNQDKQFANTFSLPNVATLSRALQGDLDAIILKTLQKKSAKRYESINQLSQDIERYLTKYPLLANPVPWYIQSQKFISRSPLSSSLALLFLVSVSSLGSAIFIQSEEVALQRDTAKLEKSKAETITQFLTNMFFEIDPDRAQGEVITVREVLDKASKNLDDETNTIKQQPLVEADLRTTIGEIYQRLGLIPLSIEHLEKALNLYKTHEGDPNKYYKLLRALSNAYNRTDQFDKQLPMLEEVVELSKKLYGENSERALGMMSNLAGLYNDTGKSQQALELHKDIYAKAKSELGDKNIVTILAITSLGADYDTLGDYVQAEHFYRLGLEQGTLVFGEKHGLTQYNLSRLGTLMESLEQFTEAKQLTLQFLKLSTEILGEKHQDTIEAKYRVARIYLAQGQLEQAQQMINDCIVEYQEVVDGNHGFIYEAQTSLVELYLAKGQLAQAQQLAEQSLEGAQQLWGASHPKTLSLKLFLADSYNQQGMTNQALVSYRSILNLLDNTSSTFSQQAYGANLGLAKTYVDNKQHNEALPYLLETLSLADAQPLLPHKKLSWVLTTLADYYESQQQTDLATPLRQRLRELN